MAALHSSLESGTDHELTVVESSSRSQKIRSDGSIIDTFDFKQEVFIKADCSCGETFEKEIEAYQHLDEVNDG